VKTLTIVAIAGLAIVGTMIVFGTSQGNQQQDLLENKSFQDELEETTTPKSTSQSIASLQPILADEPQSQTKENQTIEKKYMAKEFSFSIWQPDNWERQAVSPHPFDPELFVYSMIESSTFDEDQPTTIAVVIDDLEGLSLEDYNEAQWSKYGDILSTVGKVEFFEGGQDTTAGEKDIWYEYTYDIQLGPSMFNPVPIDVKLKGIDVVVGHEDVAYTITYLASEKNYGKHYSQFLDILDTFKFL